MKTLLASLAICTLFTGCLPPPGSVAVVTPGYHRPYGYGSGYPYGYNRDPYYGTGSPYRPYGYRSTAVVPTHRRAETVVVRSSAPPSRDGYVWYRGHWVRRR
ncbi:MAG: hypothetical protein ABIP20_05565 [Chthoniobacteraceae bacterium]